MHQHGPHCNHSHSTHDSWDSTPITIHTPEHFEGMRKAGHLAGRVLDYIAPFVTLGRTTGELNDLCHQFILDHNAIPAPLGYNGFPKSVCTSVNHVVCHGIPGIKKLAKGDIINIDVTVIVDGWHGDTSRMFTVGPVSKLAERLINTTYEAMMRGIEAVKPGNCVGDIGYAMQTHVERQGFSVVRDFTGHGIGRIFHTSPTILNFGKPGTGPELKEGMFFTIEPMVNAGKSAVKVLSDGWTAVTRDQSLSAQYEHTVGVTATGAEIFTN